MGNLHTLRRAIERDPESFVLHVTWNDTYRARSARFYEGQWHARHSYFGKSSYRNFVQSVLNTLGYTVR